MKIVSISGKVLYDSEKESMKDAVVDAVENGANLYGANLYGANLYGANLEYANLDGAYLNGANLYGVNLEGAYLGCANLNGANLNGANLSDADLRCANLRCANLECANLEYANLEYANLGRANLGRANLNGANLGRAYLYGANLIGAKNIPPIPLACPSEGAFTAWKKVDGKIIELEIPADARRSSATSDKCRCDKAKVISITDITSNEQISEVTNINYVKTLYKAGEMVYSNAFDEDRFNECSNGIHFFIDKWSAINY